MTRNLKPVHRAIFDRIVAGLLADGAAPTCREIAEGTGTLAPTAYAHIQSLIAAGWLDENWTVPGLAAHVAEVTSEYIAAFVAGRLAEAQL